MEANEVAIVVGDYLYLDGGTITTVGAPRPLDQMRQLLMNSNVVSGTV
jgi:hypothetical protein